MLVEEKVVYQTADGKTFCNKEDAERHERLQAAAQDAHDKYAAYGHFEFPDDEEFAEFVCKYADMIRGES